MSHDKLTEKEWEVMNAYACTDMTKQQVMREYNIHTDEYMDSIIERADKYLAESQLKPIVWDKETNGN